MASNYATMIKGEKMLCMHGCTGKHNFIFGGAFRKAKYEKLRWRKKKRRSREAMLPKNDESCVWWT